MGITTYTAEVSTETLSKFTSGYYSLFSKNSIIDTKIPLNNINPNELNIKIYSIRLEEI